MKKDILPDYQQTPIGLLLEYHNLSRPFEVCDSASLLVGMCMDNRKHLRIPDNFSFIIRSGGANLRYSEFKVSYAASRSTGRQHSPANAPKGVFHAAGGWRRVSGKG